VDPLKPSLAIMAKRLSLDDKLAAVRRLRDQDPSPEVTAELKTAIEDRSNLIVAAAAAIAGDQSLVELAPALAAALDRFLVDPLKTDKLCRAKLAIIQALDKLEHGAPDVFLEAARHVQMEPVWGGGEDTAAPLRAAALLALARIDVDGLLTLLVDALIDPEKEVRIAAAQALGYHATESAGLLLRLKARLGDREPEVLSECLCGLLACAPKENFPLVSGYLDLDDIPVREAAILALGRSRLPDAFNALEACWNRQPPVVLRATILLAMVMLRLPAATEFLIELVKSGPEAASLAALSALKIHSHDPRLRKRIAEVVQQRNMPTLRARFDRDFHSP
jgi:HEAT repeat protein